jgi:SpoVK/Ycf46/Vps4 family AAA+-type ATPase
LRSLPLKDFEKFVINDSHETKVHFFIKNQYGEYTFEPISVNLPENLDLSLNYGKDFLDIDKKIQDRLMEKPNGLFMFHGPPGTGKTTYIKYLANKLKRDFIYIPTTMVESFTSDPNCLHTLLQKPNSVIILEDAEKAILKRQGDGMDSSAVSALLNLSDGILSDILKTSVVLTYNCPKQDVDDALKRKGRLQVEYEFGALSVDDAKKLAKSLKYPKKFIDEKIIKPLTISEIYNLEKEVEFYAKNGKKEKSDRIIGFGK